MMFKARKIVATAAAGAALRLIGASSALAGPAVRSPADHSAARTPAVLSIVFSGATAAFDVIQIEPGKLAELSATITNVSAEPVSIIGTGGTPIVLTPANRKLAPGEAMKVAVLVTPSFAAYPISVTVGAVYSVSPTERLFFTSARVRVAPPGAVCPDVDHVVWRHGESDERVVKVSMPSNVVLKEAKVQGPFDARVQDGAVYIRPKSIVQAVGPRAGSGDPVERGSIQLIAEPQPAFRIAPIMLTVQANQPVVEGIGPVSNKGAVP